ncbi:MAG: hypothetical protein KKC71_08945 [Chloroflexi bacterium]|nr:hypothetical protein [Chloroflexota bacterium]
MYSKRSTDKSWIDDSLYPDVEPPKVLETLEARVDYLARLCAAWDFGILPNWAAVVEVRKPDWREAVDECRLLTSPSYHLLRKWHGLEELPYLGQELAYIRDDPNLAYV